MPHFFKHVENWANSQWKYAISEMNTYSIQKNPRQYMKSKSKKKKLKPKLNLNWRERHHYISFVPGKSRCEVLKSFDEDGYFSNLVPSDPKTPGAGSRK